MTTQEASILIESAINSAVDEAVRKEVEKLRSSSTDELLRLCPRLCSDVSILINGIKEKKRPSEILHKWDIARGKK